MKFELKLLKHQRQLYDSKKNIAGLVCGRGAGKTVILSWIIVFHLLQNKRVLAFSQTYKSLTQNLFDEIQKRFDELKVKAIYNKGAMTISYGKGIVFGYSYENAESSRGLTEINLLVLDELCLAPADILAITAPCLRGDFTPLIRFGTSPRKGSVWNKWISDNLATENIDVFTAKMSDNTFLSKESLELSLKAITDENMRLQEIEGQILADYDESCILSPSDFPSELKDNSFNYPLKIGIDGSGQGRDKSVICFRKGNRILDIAKYSKLDPFDCAAYITQILHRNKLTSDDVYEINIDMGYGEGYYAVLNKEYPNVNLVPFASRANNESYANKRAEMYFNLSKAVRNGLYIEDSALIEELLNTRYTLDKNDKYILLPKAELKLILNRSPDTADALALTFCEEDFLYAKTSSKKSAKAYAYSILGDPED